MIGDGPNAVVFDFAPEVQAGAELLARRGEDQRLEEDRPAAQRRKEKDYRVPRLPRGRDRAPEDLSEYGQGWVEDEVDLSPAEAKAAQKAPSAGAQAGARAEAAASWRPSAHRRQEHRHEPKTTRR